MMTRGFATAWAAREPARVGCGGLPAAPAQNLRWASANRRLCRARPRHQQLPAADRLSDRRRVSRGRFLLAHHPARRGHLGDRLHQRGRDRARDRGALDLPRQDRSARKAKRLRLIATEACRAAVERRRFPRPRRGRDRHPARGDRPRDRGGARGDRLLAAARSERPRRDPVRHRRRFDRTGADRARSGTSQTRRRASRRGCRSRSASSRWPSISAAAM